MLNIPAHVVWGDTLRMTQRRAWPTMAFWPIVHKVARWRRGDDKHGQPCPSLPTPVPLVNLQPYRLVQAELF